MIDLDLVIYQSRRLGVSFFSTEHYPDEVGFSGRLDFLAAFYLLLYNYVMVYVLNSILDVTV